MTEFIVSITRNDIDKVRDMLQSNRVDVNKSYLWNSKDSLSPVLSAENHLKLDHQEYRCKPLNIAVFSGHANMVRLLLSAGADINNKDERGRTPIICAIYGLDLDASNINTTNLHLISQTNTSHFDIMKNILLCHPNLSFATLDSPQYEIKGITPLCLASYLGKMDIIQLLLEDGRINVDGTDSKNATALMYAARDGNLPIVKALLDYHASPDLTDSHGWSAVQYAERFPDIVQMCEQVLRIKRSELVTVNSHKLNYPINYSKLSNLLNTIPNYPSSSLSHLQEQIDSIRNLDDTSSFDIMQSAFLQAIKIHDHLSLQTLLMQSPLSHLSVLINHHDPKTGLTALHHAMRTKPLPSIDTITMLFQAGADMNAQTYYGRTALHHLARFGIDKDGKSWGIQKNNTNRPEQASTFEPCVQDIPTYLAMCASLLIRFGALVNIADPTGNTPLHFAAEFGGVSQVLEVLVLEGGADLGLKNKKDLTPLDVCKSAQIRNKLIQLEIERRSCKAKSMVSSISGTIRPFDSASEYRRSTATTTVTTKNASFLFQKDQVQKQLLMDTIQRKQQDNDYTDFDIVLKSFFGYQTTFTISIESSLTHITDSVLKGFTQNLDQVVSQLRIELREAHDMFDLTNQLIEKVMMAFREELEQVEQIHQTDWEMSELQHDKIEKLFDVFERIDGRFCQLELVQDELIHQVDRLRKIVAKKLVQPTNEVEENLHQCVSQLVQSLLIIQTVPIDSMLYLRDDRNRLYQDLSVAVDKVLAQLSAQDGDKWAKTKDLIQERWLLVKDILTKPELDQSTTQYQPSRSQSQPTSLHKSSFPHLQNEPSLNELELSFDILHSNLFEIKKDIDQVTDYLEKLMLSKKKMYEICLSLEKELTDPQRPKQEIQDELTQILKFTQQLFDKQAVLDKERNQLQSESQRIEQQLDSTRNSLLKVRPPALLQGLLDRLDTNDTPSCIRIEKDWKEDSNLVTRVILDSDQESSCDSSCSEDDGQDQRMFSQLNSLCRSPLSTMCYLARLDASLYCLKVLSSHLISKSRHRLLQIQVALGQASTDLDDNRNQMTQLYNDAADVARDVFSFKTDLETIVRHRKEEVIKVWEVVDEVSQGIPKQHNSTGQLDQQQQQIVQDQDRHLWIIRELEQLKRKYEDLQDNIGELKHDQAMIGQELRQLATSFIEPQVGNLVGHQDDSLLSVSDHLAELMECIRDNDFGLKSITVLTMLGDTTNNQTEGDGAQTNKTMNTLNRLSRLSETTSRLSISTLNSGPSSVYVRSTRRTDKKRTSIISSTSLSSLSSYQQERMLTKASNLSKALAKVKNNNKN